jgi:hypothetical protein
VGWCPEFGVRIHATCVKPMVADRRSCQCDDCGTACPGRFAGCKHVWAAGPQRQPRDLNLRADSAPNVQVAEADSTETDGPMPLDDVLTAVSTLGGQLNAIHRVVTVAEAGRGVTDKRLDALRVTVDALALDLQRLVQHVVLLNRAVAELSDIRVGFDQVMQQQADLTSLIASRQSSTVRTRPTLNDRLGPRPDWQAAFEGPESERSEAPRPG